MQSTVRQEFGKDIGLVHEVVVTGRKVGADEGFWSKLAHDKKLFAQVVEFVTNDGVIEAKSEKASRKTPKKSVAAVTVTVGKYANEKVKSNYLYPQEYHGPKPIGVQVDRLAELFGLSLGYTSEYIEKVLPTLVLPEGAEGWFAIPSVDALAKRFFPEVEDAEERYARAVQLVFDKIAEQRSFYNFRNGEIDSKHLRLQSKTLEAFKQISETQKGDILIVPLQLGLRHRGKSIRLAQEEFSAIEFGLDIFSGVSVALVHPERFVRWEELDMDLPGTEWSLNGDGVFSDSVYFRFLDGRLKFGDGHLDFALGHYGSASGFVPLASSPS